jgi:hypothetical protein
MDKLSSPRTSKDGGLEEGGVLDLSVASTENISVNSSTSVSAKKTGKFSGMGIGDNIVDVDL